MPAAGQHRAMMPPRNSRLSGRSSAVSASFCLPTRRPMGRQRGTDFARYEGFGALPCLIAVAAKGEELVEDDAIGIDVDGRNLRPLDQRAHLVDAADDQDLRA